MTISPDSNTSHVIVYLLQRHFLHIFHSFKYISCYCLSKRESRGCWCKEPNSNTSHVIVYPVRIMALFPSVPIQIHLMLLFIASAERSGRCRRSIQIHLMLLFISPGRSTCRTRSAIQIHLMLLFIGYRRHLHRFFS